MSLLSEVSAILTALHIPHETGAFIAKPPDTFCVLTPIEDTFSVHGDAIPLDEVQSLRITLYTKANYRPITRQIVFALLDQDITVTARQFLGREDGTAFFSYAIDCEKPCSPHGA
jgi:hypothetical protein